jgi:hypothetical protein
MDYVETAALGCPAKRSFAVVAESRDRSPHFHFGGVMRVLRQAVVGC